MTNLLRANFYRLRRSRALWLCMGAAFALTALFLLRSSVAEGSATLDAQLMQVFPFLPVFHAAFVSLYLGVEYQDGTLRNKLIAGHTRGRVYAAYLVAAVAGCFAIALAWLLAAAVGIAKLGWFAAPAGALGLAAAVILLLTAAEAAILTLVALLLPNRAASAVSSILLMFGLIALGSVIYNALSEPELASAAVRTVNSFEIGEPLSNPSYVSGALRSVYQFAVDALPTGQASLLANQELARPVLSLCASAALTLLISAAGIALFRRKNLK